MSNTVNATIAALIATMGDKVEVPVMIRRAVVDTVPVELARFPQETVEYLFSYGLRQCLNDAKAGQDEKGAAKGLMEKRLEKLYAGSMMERGGNSTATPSDPVDRIAASIATAAIANALKVKGIPRKNVPKDTFDAMVAEHAANPAIRAEAERQHAATVAIRATSAPTFDLAALGLAAPTTAAESDDAATTDAASDATDMAPDADADSDTPAPTDDAAPESDAPAAPAGRHRNRRN